MKNSVAAVGVVLALCAVRAQAADLPAPEIPMIAQAPAAAAYDWTGFYIGGNVGYGWGTIDPKGGKNFDVNGVLGGGQIGANWQFSQFVLGLETDIAGRASRAPSAAAAAGSGAT